MADDALHHVFWGATATAFFVILASEFDAGAFSMLAAFLPMLVSSGYVVATSRRLEIDVSTRPRAAADGGEPEQTDAGDDRNRQTQTA